MCCVVLGLVMEAKAQNTVPAKFFTPPTCPREAPVQQSCSFSSCPPVITCCPDGWAIQNNCAMCCPNGSVQEGLGCVPQSLAKKAAPAPHPQKATTSQKVPSNKAVR